MLPNPIRVSIIVPVYNSSRALRECLSALICTAGPCAEIIVVDDASTDNSSSVAAEMGVQVQRLAKNSGPSAARNYGVLHSRGDILFFVDADVAVMAGSVGRVLKLLDERQDVDAVFGSYDAQPQVQGVVSQYRNLLHHFVHQQGNPEASTFWAGCGAIRRAAFEEIGGFDEKHFARGIEDIELGYRLRQAGHRIFLDKGLCGTHLKRWTLLPMVRTDITLRAAPWTRLILERKNAPHDLNLKLGQRLSVVLVEVACLFLFLAMFHPRLLVVSGAALAGVVILNQDLYSFFFRRRGLLFAAACIPLHFLYYLYSGLTFLYVWLEFQLKGAFGTHAKVRR